MELALFPGLRGLGCLVTADQTPSEDPPLSSPVSDVTGPVGTPVQSIQGGSPRSERGDDVETEGPARFHTQLPTAAVVVQSLSPAPTFPPWPVAAQPSFFCP